MKYITGKSYRERVDKQLSEWLNGNSLHNHKDNECCPDFSCCKPELLAGESMRERFVNGSDRTREKMCFKFLSRGLRKMKHKVYISKH